MAHGPFTPHRPLTEAAPEQRSLVTQHPATPGQPASSPSPAASALWSVWYPNLRGLALFCSHDSEDQSPDTNPTFHAWDLLFLRVISLPANWTLQRPLNQVVAKSEGDSEGRYCTMTSRSG
uniref:Uncharacterized protein n=1 Tax=Molossus molossus TaxID=27622 RepID=A0A7J8JWG6_MOLMO|nr:hypothetical protein HJG59_007886 [Molossus molossus]